MPKISSTTAGRRTRLIAAVSLTLLSAGLIAGCGTKDNLSTGSLPDDYRTRHPIVIGQADHAIDIPIASGDVRLPQGTRDVIRGFASRYANTASGPVYVLLPSGSPNAHSASRMRGEIAAVLRSSGIPAGRLAFQSYEADPQAVSAPVRLVYSAVTAQAGPCGEWPSDLVNNTMQNRNYENFGCASQANLAAQIANPLDLVGPRAMSPIDAAQRSQIIKDYRGID